VSDYHPAPNLDEAWTETSPALGPATGDQFDITGLGELNATALTGGASPGRITITFDPWLVSDGPGADFAVFENGFTGFMELAFVEVSSDGQNFARFPAASLTTNSVPAYTPFDPTDVFNLAGKHHNNNGESWGTPFDLRQLASHPLVINQRVRLDAIRHVRLVDIPGRGDFIDASGRPIYDPWPTFASGGFDLEAVGMIHARVVLQHDSGSLHWSRVPNRVNRLWKSTVSPAGPWTPVFQAYGPDEQATFSVAPSGLEFYRVGLEVVP
jgi:hypothetical protein